MPINSRNKTLNTTVREIVKKCKNNLNIREILNVINSFGKHTVLRKIFQITWASMYYPAFINVKYLEMFCLLSSIYIIIHFIK